MINLFRLLSKRAKHKQVFEPIPIIKTFAVRFEASVLLARDLRTHISNQAIKRKKYAHKTIPAVKYNLVTLPTNDCITEMLSNLSLSNISFVYFFRALL